MMQYAASDSIWNLIKFWQYDSDDSDEGDSNDNADGDDDNEDDALALGL